MTWQSDKYTNNDYWKFNSTERRYLCPRCQKSYSTKSAVTAHYKYDCDKPPRFECPYCGKLSKKKFNIQDHIKRKHPNQTVQCHTRN